MNDDAQRIDEALSGKTAAFGQLVQKYQDRLYNAIAHVLGSAEDARDVVQDAFVQAFVKLDSFQGSSAFYTWLYRIAFNLAISHLRRARVRVSVDEARERTGREPVDRGMSPGQRLEQEERAVQVRAALASLSAEHRGVLVLRDIDGCGYEAISEILDLPIGTVRSRLHRARLELRGALEEVRSEGVRE